MRQRSPTPSRLRRQTHSWTPVSFILGPSRIQQQSRWMSWTWMSLLSSPSPPTLWKCTRTLLQEPSLALWRLTTWMPPAVLSGKYPHLLVGVIRCAACAKYKRDRKNLKFPLDLWFRVSISNEYSFISNHGASCTSSLYWNSLHNIK